MLGTDSCVSYRWSTLAIRVIVYNKESSCYFPRVECLSPILSLHSLKLFFFWERTSFFFFFVTYHRTDFLWLLLLDGGWQRTTEFAKWNRKELPINNKLTINNNCGLIIRLGPLTSSDESCWRLEVVIVCLIFPNVFIVKD